jgi:hypothetical protein
VLLERHYFDRDRAFDRLRELGVSWVRAPLIWHRVESGSGHDWAEADSLVDAARAEGFHVHLSLIPPAPASATADGEVGVLRPDPRRFGRFARAAAEHFAGRVRRWSIWNEPNLVNWLRPVSEMPELYRRLYDEAYRAIRDVDPEASVLIGETAPYVRPGKGLPPLAFLRRLARGGPLRAGGYAHHPYSFLEPPERPYPGRDNVSMGSLDRLIRALDRMAEEGSLADERGRALDLYLTEFGYFQSTERALGARRRADYLRRAFDIAADRYPRVRQLLQYLLVRPPAGFPGGRFDTSLLTRNGRPTPAFHALAAWARRAVRDRRAVPPPG